MGVARLLQIHCSIKQEHSISRRLSDYFVAEWTRKHPDTEIESLDLITNPLPHFDATNLGGLMSPPDTHTQAMKSAMALSERLITQIERADVLAIGCPMYNFTIPSQLKAWIDHITIAGRTFRYTGPGRAEGLLVGKKIYVIAVRGGEYSEGPARAFDFQEPLLRHLLGFLGLTDVHCVRVERMQLDPAQIPAILKTAEGELAKLLS
jgi:FMN-dependent NADH-azoreductase